MNTCFSRLTGQALLDAFHAQLDLAGCIPIPASFRVGEDTDTPHPDAESSSSGSKWIDESARTVKRGVANVESVSRSGIKVHIDGMDVSQYHQNPVVLACHRHCSAALMPGAIGTIERVSKTDKATVLRFHNMRFDTDALAEAWYQKVLSGTVRMTSIGFMPTEWELASEVIGSGKNKREIQYIDIPQSELLEISVTPIGANRFAFIGQHVPGRLLQRVAAAEQQLERLQRALTELLGSEQAAVATQAKSRLLAALDSVSNHKGV